MKSNLLQFINLCKNISYSQLNTLLNGGDIGLDVSHTNNISFLKNNLSGGSQELLSIYRDYYDMKNGGSALGSLVKGAKGATKLIPKKGIKNLSPKKLSPNKLSKKLSKKLSPNKLSKKLSPNKLSKKLSPKQKQQFSPKQKQQFSPKQRQQSPKQRQQSPKQRQQSPKQKQQSPKQKQQSPKQRQQRQQSPKQKQQMFDNNVSTTATSENVNQNDSDSLQDEDENKIETLIFNQQKFDDFYEKNTDIKTKNNDEKLVKIFIKLFNENNKNACSSVIKKIKNNNVKKEMTDLCQSK
jgi:DNA primase